jgi:hypothetical protein
MFGLPPRRAAACDPSGTFTQASAGGGYGGGGRDNTSATTLSFPAICRISDVHSATNASCLHWRAVHGSELRLRANVSGL